MNTQTSTRNYRIFLLPAIIALLMNLVIGPLAPIIQEVLAAPVSIADEDGPNDEPGQKDLTKLTIDYAGLVNPSPSVFVSWNWDEISWSGNNSGDACALFDTNDNLNVDAAVCVTIKGDPATLFDVRLYECTADAKVDRCTGPAQVADPPLTDCTVAQSNDDPFAAGAVFPMDTKATCTIYLGEVAASNAELVNVCSYPSQEPNSDPSDCVLIIRDGAIRVDKVVINDSGGAASCNEFGFTINTTPVTNETFDDNPDCSNLVAVVPGTYNVTEPAVSGYATTYANNLNQNANCNGLSVPSFDVEDGPVVCTITNNDIGPALHLIKQVSNNNGGGSAATAWTLTATGAGASPTNLSGQTPVNSGAGFKADTYTLAETGPSGYTASSWSCVLTGTSTAVTVTNSAVTVGLGQDITCTISNDDNAPALHLIKQVSGGSSAATAWTLTATGAGASPTNLSGTTPVNSGAGFKADTYTLAESGPSDYTASSWSCVLTGTSTAVTVTNSAVTVGLGQDITCTITNTRQTGKLEVRKALDPSTDAGKFNLQIDGVTDPDATNVGNGGSTGEQTLDTGLHTVGEIEGTSTSLDNYASSIVCHDGNGLGAKVAEGAGAGPLNVTVTNGSDIVCVITNNRVTVGFTKADDNGENDRNVEPGETIHYTLTVIVNTGTATNVEVTDTLPDGLTYVTGSAVPSAGFSVSGQDLTWTVASLGAGPHTFVYDATVDADATGSLTNLGCVDVDQNDALVCDSTTLLVQDIEVIKTNGATAPVVRGTPVDFTLTLDVTNGPIDNVTIVDDLPAGITNATSISDGGIYDATANTITWALTNVVDNETLTYTATVTATAAAGAQTNVATITEGPCVGDCDDESTVIVRIPTLVTDKVASTETITISGPANALVATPSVVTWTISYTLANGPVTGAVIKDAVPTGFTFLDAANGGTFAGGEVTWNLGTLTTSGSVSFRTTVNPATISRTGPTVNTAIIDSNETTPDEGQDSVTVTVVPPPLGGTPTPRPPLPNTATGIGMGGAPVTVPVELLVVFFIGSLGALALANVRASSRRR